MSKRTGFSPKALLLCLVLFAGAAAALLVTPGELEARTKCGTTFEYYSDATFTNLVGVRSWLPSSCGCDFSSWGSITIHRLTLDSSC